MLHSTTRSARGFLTAAALVFAACQSASTPEIGTTPAPSVEPAEPEAGTMNRRTPNTLEGIYTPAQARRGRRVFENTCSACHAPEDWQDGVFLSRWEGESVYRFWYYLYEAMPDDQPPYSLPREQVTDVLTYILQLNGVPAGEVELGSDDDSIDNHWLYWSSP